MHFKRGRWQVGEAHQHRRDAIADESLLVLEDLIDAIKRIPGWAVWAILGILALVTLGAALSKKKRTVPTRSFIEQ